MPRFSAFTPFGQLRFSARPSDAEQLYKSLKAQVSDPKTGMSPYDLTPGTHQEAKLYAQAMGLAAAKATVDRAGNQGNPLKAKELLPSLEEEFLIVPGASDTLLDRQRAVAAKKKLPRGARRESVVDALRTLLGSDFIAYRPVAWSEATIYPADPTSSNQINATRVDIPPKFVRLLEPVTDLGAPIWVAYANWDRSAGEVTLATGELVMVQPENTALAERVTIMGVRGSGPTREFRAIFTNPHDIDAAVTTMNFPWQFSTSRFAFVIVKTLTAINPEKRRKVDDIMARVARGVSSWTVVQPTAPGALTIGPFSLPVPLGAVPLGQLAFTPSP